MQATFVFFGSFGVLCLLGAEKLKKSELTFLFKLDFLTFQVWWCFLSKSSPCLSETAYQPVWFQGIPEPGLGPTTFHAALDCARTDFCSIFIKERQLSSRLV